jgi:hypothetical protein
MAELCAENTDWVRNTIPFTGILLRISNDFLLSASYIGKKYWKKCFIQAFCFLTLRSLQLQSTNLRLELAGYIIFIINMKEKSDNVHKTQSFYLQVIIYMASRQPKFDLLFSDSLSYILLQFTMQSFSYLKYTFWW